MGRDIREIDSEIIRLFEERLEAYINIRRSGKDETSSLLEEKKALQSYIESLEKESDLKRILINAYREILSGSYSLVLPVTIAFLGPEGTFTHMAMNEIFGDSVDKLPVKTISDIFREVESGNAHYGVVPVENSTEGGVTFTLDELIETDLSIVAEKNIKISYSLLSLENSFKDIRRVYSHPQTLGQCKEWLRKNLPDVEIVPVDSTSRAAEISSGEKKSAAISSVVAGEIFGLNSLAERIEDLRQNYTRFFALGREESSPTGEDKTSIVCAIMDKPGALLDLLKPLSSHGINMTKIESRPNKKKMWEYNFFIDFMGHKNDRIVFDALQDMKSKTAFLKILGSYPIGAE
jgi:chorismate mutase / prephenate dehydratase